jgi:formyltetrahydrofolate deformylase
MPLSATLLIHCQDQRGLIAKITQFLKDNNGNILSLDQYVESADNRFFMRVKWDLDGFGIPREKIAEYFEHLLASKYKMEFKLYFSDILPRMAIFVSKFSHCLYDLLSRVQSGEWQVEVPVIVSNHEDMRKVAENFGIEYYYFPIDAQNKAEQEAAELEILKYHQIDFIVLARYMQVLSDDFVRNYPNKVINIHHSFLPAFKGAKPYHSAYERGVKIIGATGHYVTADLDEGPIIEQDVTRVEQHDSIQDLVRKGQDLEKVVLARSVFYHLQRRTLVHGNKVVIFKG